MKIPCFPRLSRVSDGFDLNPARRSTDVEGKYVTPTKVAPKPPKIPETPLVIDIDYPIINLPSAPKETIISKLSEISEVSEIDEDQKRDTEISQSSTESTGNKINRRQGVPIDNVDNKLDEISLEKVPKRSQDEEQIRKALIGNEFMSQMLEDEKINMLVDVMYPKFYKAKENIINEGENGFHMYVSAEGKFEILINNNNNITFGPGKVFGELAILYSAKRNATIRALTNSKVWVLDRNKYQAIMVKTGLQEQEDKIKFLSTVPYLKKIEDLLPKVAELLRKEFFGANSVIVRQGDPGDKFYIIRVGSVSIERNSKHVGNLTRGQFFGELALKTTDVRQATVTANPPGVDCLTLDRESFNKYLGTIDDILEERVNYAIPTPQPLTDDTNKLQSFVNISRGLEDYNKIKLEELTVIGTLGIGGFGRVELVQDTKSKKTFALKYLKKIDMIAQQQQKHAFNEKNLMLACDSPFIVKLYKTYKDSKYLYFLMEACLGGDVFKALQDFKKFDEKTSRFISACVIEGFEYLHKKNIIYRDLKPENLMLDNKGYVKLVDFGFAIEIKDGKSRWTFAGTPEYVAPEILLNRGHNHCVDLWTLGILIHELLLGKPPFRGRDQMETYNLILRGIDAVPMSSRLMKSAQSLIKKLLRPTPLERLGTQKEGFQDIKNHKWYMGFDWEALRRGKLDAPLKRPVKNTIDLTNFEKFQKDDDDPPDDDSSWDKDF